MFSSQHAVGESVVLVDQHVELATLVLHSERSAHKAVKTISWVDLKLEVVVVAKLAQRHVHLLDKVQTHVAGDVDRKVELEHVKRTSERRRVGVRVEAAKERVKLGLARGAVVLVPERFDKE